VRAQGRPDERLPGGVVVEFKLDSAVQGGLWLEDEAGRVWCGLGRRQGCRRCLAGRS